MAMQWTFKRADSRGFTLIELMVVVVIVSILMAIAIPSYKNSIRKSRRTDAKTALLDLAGREERYNSTNGSYTNAAANLGYASWGIPIGSGYYTIAAPTVVAGTATTVASFSNHSHARCGQRSSQRYGVRRIYGYLDRRTERLGYRHRLLVMVLPRG